MYQHWFADSLLISNSGAPKADFADQPTQCRVGNWDKRDVLVLLSLRDVGDSDHVRGMSRELSRNTRIRFPLRSKIMRPDLFSKLASTNTLNPILGNFTDYQSPQESST